MKVSDLVLTVLNEVFHFALNKEVEIMNGCQDDSILVFADAQMLKIVLRNLLMNAVKFSNHKSKVFVNVADNHDGFLLFSVKDEGVGINKNKLDSIFDLQKNDSTVGTDGEKGVGLGLVLCHDFVELHHGKIWVESELGIGSTFYFTIPKQG